MAPRQANHQGEAGLLKGRRIRQIVRLGPLMRLNLSKTGVSLSLGNPGLTVNLGRGRRRTTISAPGTGISYSESEPLGGPEDRSPDARGAQEPAPQRAQAPPARKSLVQALSSWLHRDK